MDKDQDGKILDESYNKQLLEIYNAILTIKHTLIKNILIV